jgi:hypothetical protein
MFMPQLEISRMHCNFTIPLWHFSPNLNQPMCGLHQSIALHTVNSLTTEPIEYFYFTLHLNRFVQLGNHWHWHGSPNLRGQTFGRRRENGAILTFAPNIKYAFLSIFSIHYTHFPSQCTLSHSPFIHRSSIPP